MAIVNFNKKQFEKDIGKLDEQMQNKIALFGTPVEAITQEDIQLEIFPNRPDLLSYQGFIRSFLPFLGKSIGLRKYKINPPKKDFCVIVDKSVEKIRPYTACAIIKNMKFDDQKIRGIIDLQEKLHNTIGRKRKKIAIGIYPLNKINFPITFKALEPDKIHFIPLGMKEELSGFQILQRNPAGREYSHLLAQKEKYPIFIDSKNQILSMPPIINSELTGKIEENTKDIFIECSGFDLNILKKCLNIIVTALADMSGDIQAVEVRYSKKEITPNLNPEKMKINIENINKLLGLNLKEKQINLLLEKMGYGYQKNSILIPAWRIDILHEVDIIEDVAISYGYNNFTPIIPKLSMENLGEYNKNERIKKKIAEILAGKEFLELSNYHLTTKEDQFLKIGLKAK
ncbi:MAG: phenylalanine--tRNA ligase subunit beta, partial [Nanoarchaeota archaeon]